MFWIGIWLLVSTCWMNQRHMIVICCLQEAPPAVTNAHLRAAFDSAQPSVSAQEAARLSALYGRFRHSRDPGWGGPSAAAGQRVTLA